MRKFGRGGEKRPPPVQIGLRTVAFLQGCCVCPFEELDKENVEFRMSNSSNVCFGLHSPSYAPTVSNCKLLAKVDLLQKIEENRDVRPSLHEFR